LKARRRPVKKRSIHVVCEYFSLACNAAIEPKMCF
jgi:hypothetical protein